MHLIKKLLALAVFVCIYTASHAQAELSYIKTKGFDELGYGAFLNFSIPITETDAAVVEGAAYYYSDQWTDAHMVVVPALGGWRHLLDPNNDHGLYLEPVVGYSFGSSDIQKSDADGNPLYRADGNPVNIKVAGPTAGLGFGYLFEPSGRLQFSLSLRYEHTFTIGDNGLNIFSLRVSHSFSFGSNE